MKAVENDVRQEKEDKKGVETALFERLECACSIDYLLRRPFYAPFLLSPHHLDSVCRASAVLEALLGWYQENKIPLKVYAPVFLASSWIGKNGQYFPVKCLPKNPTRLMEKLRSYAELKSPINQTVVLKNRPQKVERERWWHGVAIYLLNENRNYSQASILSSIRELSEKNSEKCPMRKTLSQFLRKQRGFQSRGRIVAANRK